MPKSPGKQIVCCLWSEVGGSFLCPQPYGWLRCGDLALEQAPAEAGDL